LEHTAKPTHRLRGDIEWCIASLGDVADTERERTRALIARAIVHPTAAREELFTALAELIGELAESRDE
jgi:hypothetical protein